MPNKIILVVIILYASTVCKGLCPENLVNDLELYCHTSIDDPIPAYADCPYKEEVPFWVYYQTSEGLKTKNDYEYARAKLDQQGGYYRSVEKSIYYEQIVISSVPATGSGDCLSFNAKDWKINFGSCEDMTKLCYYDQVSTPNFCEAYEKICSLEQIGSKCYCYTDLTDGFYCKLDCPNDPMPNYCKVCDKKFMEYGQPKLSLTLEAGQPILRIENELKLKRLQRHFSQDRLPVVCYINADLTIFQINEQDSNINSFEFIPMGEEGVYRLSHRSGHFMTGVFWCIGFTYPNFEIIRSEEIHNIELSENYYFHLVMNVSNDYNILDDPEQIPSDVVNIITEKSITSHLAGVTTKGEATVYVLGKYTDGNDVEEKVQMVEEDMITILKSEVRMINMCRRLIEPNSVINSELEWESSPLDIVIQSHPQCFDDHGKPIERICGGDFFHGGIWGEVIGDCKSLTLEGTTELLNDLLNSNFSSDVINKELNNIIKGNSDDWRVYDIVLIAKLIDKISQIGDNYSLNILVESVNYVMDFDAHLLKSAQMKYNGTDMILAALDNALSNYLKEFVSEHLIIFSQNIDVFLTTIPNDASSYAVAFHENNKISILNESAVKENLESDILSIALLPNELLKQFLNRNRTNLVAALFKKASLFNSENVKGNTRLTGNIPSVSIVDLESSVLNEPLHIYVKPFKNSRRNSFCTYWRYGQKASLGYWSRDHKPLKRSTYYLCKYNHMTHFAILLDLPSDEILDILSIIGSSISLVAIAVIYTTAILSAKWRESDGVKIALHSSATIVIQTVFLFAANHTDSYEKETVCVIIGTFLHYGIISQFLWMLIMGILQYRKFVIVFTGSNRHLIMFSSIVGWLFPVLPIVLTLILEYQSYTHDEYCYLTGPGLYWGVFLPITIIIVINIIIFVRIFYEFGFKKRNGTYGTEQREYYLYIKLCIFLFSILGFTWMFGLLNGFFRTPTLSYIYCISASLQGVVLFWFYIIMNNDAKHTWKRLIHQVPICSSFNESQNNTVATNSSRKRNQQN